MGGVARQSVMAQTQGSSPSAIGFALRRVVILEVHPDKNICLANDVQTNETFQVGLNKRGSSSVWPQAGDGWIVDRSMGHWALKSKITPTQAPTFTGSQANSDPGLLQLVGLLNDMGVIQESITAGVLPVVSGSRTQMDPATRTIIDILAARGLITDSTTAAAALPAISGSRNAMSPATAALIDILAARGILTDSTTAATAPIGVWQTPTLQNGWVAGSKFDASETYNPPIRYRLTGDNHLEFSGWLNSGTSTAFTVMFSVPSGYTPLWDHYVSGYRLDTNNSTTPGTLMAIKVLGTHGEGASAGQVQIISGSSTNITGMNVQILGRVPLD